MCHISLALVFPDRDGLQVERALGVLAESCGPVEISTNPCHGSSHLLWPKADARMSHECLTNESAPAGHTLGPSSEQGDTRQICRAHESTMTRGIAAAVKIERRCQSFRLMFVVLLPFRQIFLFCGLINDYSAKQLRHDSEIARLAILFGYKR